VARKIDDKTDFSFAVKLEDSREIRKLEARLWRYGQIVTNQYVRVEDRWGRMTVRGALYVLKVPRSQIAIIKHSLTKLSQRNGFTVFFFC